MMFSAASRCWLRVGRCRSIVGGSGLSSTHHHSRMISDVMGWQQLQTKNIPLFFGHQQYMQRWQSSISHRSNRKEIVRISFDDCRNVGDVLKLVVMKHIDKSAPIPTAATLNAISRLIFKDQRFHHNRIELEQQIGTLLQHTTDSLSRSRQKELATITLSIAKVVRSIREAHQRKRVNIYHQALGKVLQESNSNPNQGFFHALAKATDANLPQFESQALANTAYAYALLGYDPKIDERSLLGVIAEKSIDRIHQFKAQEYANTVWSYAKLNVDNPRLFQSVGDAVASKRDLNEFAPQALANIVWAYATTKTQHAGLFHNVGDGIVALDDLRSFNPQELANIVWAYATNKAKHPNLFQKVGDSIASSDGLKPFQPQNLANIVWAYAKNNTQHAGLFQKIGDCIIAMDDLRSFNPQNLATIVWAYATNKTWHHSLFQKVGDSIAANDDLSSFKPQDYANILWAYATNKTQHHVLFQKVGNSVVAMDDLRSFKPQDFANIVWAYATNNLQHHNLFRKVGDAIASSDGSKVFTTQNLANIVWAYATNNVQHPNLFQNVGDVITSSDGSKVFTTQALANIVWAYAKLDVKHHDLFKKIGKSIGALDDLSSFDSQALANIAWSFAVVDMDVPVAFNHAFARALLQKENEFVTMHLRQLYKWHVWQVKKSNRGLPESILVRCERAFETSRSSSSAPNDKCSSILHDTINYPNENHLPAYNEPLVGNISYQDDGLKASTASVGNTDSQPSINPPKATHLESMTVPELKDLLRTKGLKVGGRKDELIARLLAEAPR
eukprot:scaffold17948_cov37-Cyclotella_meneghiniana.AAC.1